MYNIAFLGLGSNINALQNIKNAIIYFKKNNTITVIKTSSIYLTEPLYITNQNYFINCVIKIKTNLQPLELLKFNQQIEKDFLRKKNLTWGPRTLDIDILLFNNQNYNHNDLIIPHPKIQERSFVLVPLYELEKNIIFNNNISIKEAINKTKHQYIKKINPNNKQSLCSINATI